MMYIQQIFSRISKNFIRGNEPYLVDAIFFHHTKPHIKASKQNDFYMCVIYKSRFDSKM